MSTTLWWIFDIAVILIAVYVIVTNGKRGVTKSFVLAIGYIITTVAASLLAAAAAPVLYHSVAHNNNISGIITANKHMDFPQVFATAITEQEYGFVADSQAVLKILSDPEKNQEFEDALYQYANVKTGGTVAVKSDFDAVLREAFISSYGNQLGDRLPKYVRMYFERQVRQDPGMMRELISTYYNGSMSDEQRAEVLEQAIAAKPTTEVLQIFIYFIIFSVVMVIVAIISAVPQNRMFFNIQNSTDHAVGALLGVLEAGAMLVLLTLLVRLIVLLTGGSTALFNDETIADSILFSFFYNHLDILL